MALHLQTQMFMSRDQLTRASQVLVKNKRSSEIWKFNLKMMGTYCIYHISYLNTPTPPKKRKIDMDLMCPIVIKNNNKSNIK